jgi:hypothetical protein
MYMASETRKCTLRISPAPPPAGRIEHIIKSLQQIRNPPLLTESGFPYAGAMALPATESESAAFLAMAGNLRVALTERAESIRDFRERYDILHDDPRVAPAHRLKAAEELVRAAYKADHLYEERIAAGLIEYQRLLSGSDGSRF